MNETDLKYALRGAMDAAGGRPPMDEVAVLDAAKRAERRRGALLAGGVSATAVAGIAIAAVALYGNGGPGMDIIPAAPGDPTAAVNPPDETAPSWPNGQTDRTAANGPRTGQGVALLDALAAPRPAGFDAPTDLTYDPALGYAGEPRMHEAQFVERVGGTEVWEYRATAPISAGGGVGKLYAEVYTPGSHPGADGCELAESLWGIGGECTVVDVRGTPVGVVTAAGDPSRGFDQWAAHRRADGTVVFVAQARTYPQTLRPGLPQQPFTVEQLAALATDDRFDLE